VRSFVVLVLINISVSAKGQALDPAQSTRALMTLFDNCEFSGEETFKLERPHNASYLFTTEFAGWVCPEAMLKRTSSVKKLFKEGDSIGKAAPQQQYLECSEVRWTPTGSRLQSDLSISDRASWPFGTVASDTATFQSVLHYPYAKDDWTWMWADTLLGEFVCHGRAPYRLALIDMVTENGKGGFRLADSTGAVDNAQESVTFHFVSDEYGKCSAVFAKNNGQWVPTRFTVTWTRDDRTFISESGESNRLKDWAAYTDFSKTPAGLDELEATYEIEYDGLPKSLKKTELRRHQGERSEAISRIVFKAFRPGEVTPDGVRQAMLPIPDGTEVLPTDDARKAISWVYKDGDVVKAIDTMGVDTGRSATFSSQHGRSIRITGTAIVVAILLAVVLYRRMVSASSKGV
jgi:hypothetical protein